jgi:hypothetical protein
MAIDTAPVSTRTVLGYARVSTGHQSLDQQVDALTSAGVDPTRVYSDKLSGTSTREQRPGLSALLEYARRATPSSRPCSSGPARASRAFRGVADDDRQAARRGPVPPSAAARRQTSTDLIVSWKLGSR